MTSHLHHQRQQESPSHRQGGGQPGRSGPLGPTARVRQLVARLCAGALLLGLVAGVPALLLTVHRDPRALIPSDLPPVDRLAGWAWRELRWAWYTGDLIIDGLAVVAWLGWATLAGMALLEMAVQLRHGGAAASRVLAASGPRRWISGLITTTVLAGTLDATASAAIKPAADAAATAPVRPGPTDNTDTRAQRLPQPREPRPVSYTALCPRIATVVGDSLWGLAEQHLGNGARYHEILALNPDRLSRSTPHHIEPGWELLLPPDATNLPQHRDTENCDTIGSRLSGAETAPARVVDVAAGETLSSIAARELGDPRRWSELYRANHRRPQPDGRALLHADVILPGWTLHIPDSPEPRASTANHHQHDGHHERKPHGDDDDDDAGPTTEEHGNAAQPGPDRQNSDRPPPDTSPAPQPSAPAMATADSGLDLGPEFYVAVSLAAAVSAAVALARVKSRRRAILRDRDATHGSYSPLAPSIYDLHIAHLGHAHATGSSGSSGGSGGGGAGGGGSPDDSVGSSSADRAIPREVTAQRRADPPESAPQVGQRVWPSGPALLPTPRDCQRDLAEDLAAGHLGRTASGGLGLTGPGANGVCRHLLASVLADPHGRVIVPTAVLADLQIDAAVASPPANPASPAGPGLILTRTLAEAIAHAEAITEGRRTHFDTSPASPPSPAVLILPASDLDAHRVAELAHRGAPRGLSVLVVGDHAAGTTVDVTATGRVSGSRPPQHALVGARLHHIPADATRDILDVLDVLSGLNVGAAVVDRPTRLDTDAGVEDAAVTTDPQGAPPAQHHSQYSTAARHSSASRVPEAPDVPAAAHAELARHEAQTADTGEGAQIEDIVGSATVAQTTSTSDTAASPSLIVRLIGPMSVNYRRSSGDGDAEIVDVTSDLQPRPLHLLAYLALYPDGVHRDTLVADLWGETVGDRSGNVVATTLSRLRRQLTQATGAAGLDPVRLANGRLRLEPDLVAVDYWSLTSAEHARRTATTEQDRDAARRAVLAAYTATLADGLHCDWIEPAREAARLAAVDAATALARHTASTDPAGALDLLEHACALDPYNDHVYRDSMHLQARLGRHDAVTRTLTRLRNRLADIDEQPHPHTVALAHQLAVPPKAQRI